MPRQSQEPNADGAVQFDTQGNEVGAKTVVTTLDALDTALEEIALGMDSNRQALMKIRPFRPGSFVIPFAISLTSQKREDWLIRESPGFLEELLMALKAYFGAKLLLGGKAVRSFEARGNFCLLISQEGQSLEVPKIVLSLLDRNKGQTDAKFAEAFSVMERETAIQAVSASVGSHESLFRVSRRDYANIAFAQPAIENVAQHKNVTARERLRIVTVSFDPDLKWKLNRRTGERITASVCDDEFLKHMKLREDRFADGDSLEVTLTFQQVRNSPEEDWQDVTGSHEVVKVHKHDPMPRTGTLEFGELDS